jgi:hypothetical protein
LLGWHQLYSLQVDRVSSVSRYEKMCGQSLKSRILRLGVEKLRLSTLLFEPCSFST